MLVSETAPGAPADTAEIIGQLSTFKVNANNTTTPIEQITARSLLYDVTFTFNVTQATYKALGAAIVVSDRTVQVNTIAGDPRVVAVRGEEDTGPDGNLYNYLVITVGTPDLARTAETRVRMDHLDAGPAAIDAAWQQMNALAPVTAPGG
jgi:hypothetical protein